MANNHGGQRAGAGRKSKRIKFPAQVGKLDDRLAGQVEKSARNLIKLANGGYPRVTKVMKMAGLITKPEYQIVEGPRGGKTAIRKEVPMFPDLPPETLICVEERHEWADPDRAANEYIIDRIAGRTSEMEPPEDNESALKVTDETRKAALENMNAWRNKSQQQLASIRNPLTGQTLSESESESGASLSHEDSTMDEF